MKILFCGLGSIGQRHLRLAQARFAGQTAEFVALRSGQGTGDAPAGVRSLRDWDEVGRERPVVAFICNPTSLHVETALECARRGMHLFIEKPIASSTQGLAELQKIVSERELTPPERLEAPVRQIQAPELVDDATQVEPMLGRRSRRAPEPPEAETLWRSDPEVQELVDDDADRARTAADERRHEA